MLYDLLYDGWGGGGEEGVAYSMLYYVWAGLYYMTYDIWEGMY